MEIPLREEEDSKKFSLLRGKHPLARCGKAIGSLCVQAAGQGAGNASKRWTVLFCNICGF